MANNAKKGNDSKKVLVIAIIIVVIVGVCTTLICMEAFGGKGKGQDASVSDTEDGAVFDYQKAGNLKLGTYKDVVVDVTPSDDDLQSEIDSFCEDHGYKKDRKVKKGDTVTMDYVGTIDGKEFDGGSAEEEIVTVGDYEYLKDFENGMIGAEAGSTITVPVKFPEDYGDDELNGKQAEFKITISSINLDFTDEAVNEVTKGKYKTTAEYEEKLKKDIRKENEDCKADTAWEQVKDASELNSVPDAAQATAESDMNLMYEQFGAIQGMTKNEVLEQFGMSEDDIPELATDLAKERMIAKTIAALENIQMDDEFYKKALIEAIDDDEVDANTITIPELEKKYREVQTSRPKDDMLIVKVKSFIEEHVKISK